MNSYIVYTVNNKAVTIIQKHTHTWLVQFVKSGKCASVHKKYIKYFKVKRNKLETNQLKLNLK